MWPEPVTLIGTRAVLEPLSQSHASDLAKAAAGVQGLWYTMIPAPKDVAAEIDRRNGLGNMLAFAILDQHGVAVVMTTYMNIDAANRRIEIGSTWLGKSAQRGPINTECKLLLLRHAFETLECIAVEFRTHYMNIQSRRAIERLGAKYDGIVRNHMIMENGTLRDTAGQVHRSGCIGGGMADGQPGGQHFYSAIGGVNGQQSLPADFHHGDATVVHQRNTFGLGQAGNDGRGCLLQVDSNAGDAAGVCFSNVHDILIGIRPG